MTEAELAEIRGRIGDAEPPTDETLTEWFEELGTVDRVVLRVMEGRFQGLLSKPAKYTIEGDSSFDWSANLQALQKDVAALRDETGASGPAIGQLVKKWNR